MAKFNGHRSWNAWNVHLWLTSHDCETYRYACDIVRRHGLTRGARILAEEMEGQRTPDGARYNFTSIREALRGIQ